MNLRVFAALTGLFCASQFHSAMAASLSWTNTAGGNWTNAANWSPNQVPGSADQAAITTAGNYTVVVSANTTVGGLTVGAGTGVQSLEHTNGTFTLNGETRILAGG